MTLIDFISFSVRALSVCALSWGVLALLYLVTDIIYERVPARTRTSRAIAFIWYFVDMFRTLFAILTLIALVVFMVMVIVFIISGAVIPFDTVQWGI